MKINFPINWSLVGLAVLLCFPSLGLVQKFFGNTGVVCYLVGSGLTLWALHHRALAPATNHEKWLRWMTALGFVALVVGFAWLYPLANSGAWGRGSDNDEALNIATRELLAGRFPYYPRTYLGNPISPLPGSLLLAVPFVLLGNSAYQSFFWLALLVFVMARLSGSRAWALFPGLLLLPFVPYSIIVGMDYVANAIFVLIFVLGLLMSSKGSRFHWAWAVLLGVGLASRANFLLILPLVFSALASRTSARTAAKALSLTLLVFLVVTVPFYWHDPAHFSPWHTANKLGRYNFILPHADALITVLSASLALWFAWRGETSLRAFARYCAIVLAVPAWSVVVLDSLSSGFVNLRFAHFGVFALLFTVLSLLASNNIEHRTRSFAHA